MILTIPKIQSPISSKELRLSWPFYNTRLYFSLSLSIWNKTKKTTRTREQKKVGENVVTKKVETKKLKQGVVHQCLTVTFLSTFLFFVPLFLFLSDFLFSFFAILSFLPSFHFSSPSSWWETKIMMMSGMKPIIGTWDTQIRGPRPPPVQDRDAEREGEGRRNEVPDTWSDPSSLFFFLFLLASFFFFIPNRFVFCKAFFVFVSHCVCLSQCDGRREKERLLRVRKMERRKESSQKIHFHPFLCFLCLRQKTFLSSSRFSTWV